ncbi:50S ribosomal protein L23 [candidate division WOR-3 bacterium JGI_Cruoil_03_51_56]|uniref:Large ribosomal subunit protein uL23 n=1 Tax=candidate division WOR-3 bacterium JGI_Cruoil_03_51_56 TaxID=1973747 RepID=A0A235BXP9_UNCW3|nr:MAG: 50S ribosomal protein L23 [candidate division WOR-3 bacterium JGI_Cruoil_03_51_56]
MVEPTSVILGAVVTEKAERLKTDENRYTFRVAPGANKIEIRQAVEILFKVHVRDVKVINLLGKKRRMGMFTGRRPSWKKAMVALKKGDSIEALER